VALGTVAIPLVWGTGSKRYKVEYLNTVEVGAHMKSRVMSLMSKVDAKLGKIVTVAQELSLALYKMHKSGTAIVRPYGFKGKVITKFFSCSQRTW
jgi:hypothetical protein